jgi:hypothetical protein
MEAQAYQTEEGPADTRFRITDGKLLFNPHRDVRCPYIYEIGTHTHVHSPHHIKKILMHIVDTSEEARITRAKFEKTLSVRLGPNALMEKYGEPLGFVRGYGRSHFPTITPGLFELEAGTILFARPLREDGYYREEDDIVESWCLNGYVELPLPHPLFF